ncbi:MAG: amidohydrolase family protein [Ilumatobacteraceae bacterium]
MSGRVAITNAEVDGLLVDVILQHGRVIGIGPHRHLRGAQGDTVIDAGGGALIPGLHDHHVHLLASAAALMSVDARPSRAPTREALGVALRSADRELPPGAWIRAVGYHETVAGRLDRVALDTMMPTRPVRVQHRSGHAWFLNSSAIEALGFAAEDAAHGVELDDRGEPTGVIHGNDDWYRCRLPAHRPDLAAVGRRLAGFGVTGVTDATPSDDPSAVELISAAVRRGDLRLEVAVMASPSSLSIADREIRYGPEKIVIADHALPSLDAVVDAFRTARSRGRNVAVHCVTRVAVILALAAWAEVGARPGDRIEHGAVIPIELDDRIRDLGLVVITQPSFVADRGDDYLREVEPDDAPVLWRCGTLRSAGIGVAGSTDAPYGDPDPWRAIAAAGDRRTNRGAVLGPGDRVPSDAALRMFLTPLDDPAGPCRSVVVGTPADLCLLDRGLTEALRGPTSGAVRTVLRNGEVVVQR